MVGKSVYECTRSAKSTYFHSLDGESRERYKKKLEATDLSVADDPYLPRKDVK